MKKTAIEMLNDRYAIVDMIDAIGIDVESDDFEPRLACNGSERKSDISQSDNANAIVALCYAPGKLLNQEHCRSLAFLGPPGDEHDGKPFWSHEEHKISLLMINYNYTFARQAEEIHRPRQSSS